MPARAHPHIWVDVRTEILFDAQGRVNGIRHFWTFDPAFSAWSIQGLDTNGDGTVSRDEMQELADLNTESLAEFDYYTFAGEGEVSQRQQRAWWRRLLDWAGM